MKRVALIATVVLVLIATVALVMQGATPSVAALATSVRDRLRPDPAVVAPAAAVEAPAPEATLPSGPAATPAPSPVVTPKPAPAPSAWAKAPALASAVAEAMTGFSGEYSVAVQDLKSGEHWVLNGDQWYHPASTIKMPVTLYALDRYRAGKLSWQQGITYTEADYESPGGGAFETAPFGGVYPVENLVNRALMYSNNVAVNMLGRYLGWGNIREWSRTIDGELARLDDGTPQVKVTSELGWWLHLNQVSQEDPKTAELILTPLRNVAYDGRIPAGLPKSVSYLHKFGSYDGYFHDGGIVYAERPYALVVLTHGASEGEADEAIAQLSAAVYQVMNAK